MPVSLLNNKIVFITGAGAGIGYETAKAFADNHCIIIATDVSSSALNDLAIELKSSPSPLYTFELDVSDRNAFFTLAEKIISEIGCPDIIVNNAGLGYMGSVEDTSPEMWDLTLNVNVKGVVNGCQAFLPAMKAAQSHKHIVNVASLASRAPVPNMSAYAASKFAVEGFSKTLSMELEETQVDVTCVHPAVINTAIVRNEKMVNPNISDEQIERLQHYYTSKGCHPSVVAKDIVKAVKTGRFSLYTGPDASVTALLMRLLPWSLAKRLTTSAARRVGYL